MDFIETLEAPLMLQQKPSHSPRQNGSKQHRLASAQAARIDKTIEPFQSHTRFLKDILGDTFSIHPTLLKFPDSEIPTELWFRIKSNEGSNETKFESLDISGLEVNRDRGLFCRSDSSSDMLRIQNVKKLLEF